MTSRRDFLAAASGVLAAYAAPSRRPNLVLILPDQMRGQDMGCAGNGEIHTPSLDRLASEGAYLPNTFANTPVCCPARAILMTGTYCHVTAWSPTICAFVNHKKLLRSG